MVSGMETLGSRSSLIGRAVFSLVSNKKFGISLDMKSALSILLLCFLLASCGEEKTVETEKTIQERAEAGDAEAQTNLGMMYGNGLGVPQDSAEALKWYRKAAEQGHAIGQFQLGWMYTSSGVPQDNVKAYMFFNLAAAQGDKDAEKYREQIGEKMTQEQIAEGQKLTREWLERKAKEKGQ